MATPLSDQFGLRGRRLGADIAEVCPIFRAEATGIRRRTGQGCQRSRTWTSRFSLPPPRKFDHFCADWCWRELMAHALSQWRRRFLALWFLVLLGTCAALLSAQ